MKYVNHNDMENPGFNTIENTSYIDKIYDMDLVKIIVNSQEYHGYIKKILDSGDIQVKLAGDKEIYFTKDENNDKKSLYLDLESQIYIQEYHTNMSTYPIMHYQSDKKIKLEYILPNDNDLRLYYNDGRYYPQSRTRIHRLIRNNKKMYKGYFWNYSDRKTDIHDIEVNYEEDFTYTTNPDDLFKLDIYVNYNGGKRKYELNLTEFSKQNFYLTYEKREKDNTIILFLYRSSKPGERRGINWDPARNKHY